MKDIVDFFKDIAMEKHYKRDRDVCEWCLNYKNEKKCLECDEGSNYIEQESDD